MKRKSLKKILDLAKKGSSEIKSVIDSVFSEIQDAIKKDDLYDQIEDLSTQEKRDLAEKIFKSI